MATMGARSPGSFFWLAAATANAVLLLGFSVNAQAQAQGPTPTQSGAADPTTLPPVQAQPQQQSRPVADAQVQPPVFQPFLGIRAVATDNGALTTSDLKKSDLIGDVEAGLFFHRKSARVNLSGDMRLNFVGYANNTQSDRIVPSGQADLTAELVEQAFFVDTAIEASRTRADVFAPQGVGPSTANTISTISYRLSPYFARELTPEIFAVARSDSVFVQNFGDDPALPNTQQDARLQRFILRLDRRPSPLGISLQAFREDTRYSDASRPALMIESARAIASAAFSGDLRLGVIAGKDRGELPTGDFNDYRYGLMSQWRPALRTELDAELEHRFFGTGWFVHFRHRTPLAAFDLTTTRVPAAAPGAFGIGRSRSDIGSMLDSLLTRRIPNVSVRAEEVHDFLLRHESSEFAAPIAIASDSAQLVQRTQLNVVLNGVRTTLTGTLFYAKAEELRGDSGAPSTQGLDTRQWGGAIALDRQLSREISGHVRLEWNDVEGLGTRIGDYAKQVTAHIGVNRALTRRTDFGAGLRRLWSRSFTAGDRPPARVDETQAFAGLRTRF